jgi:hypothetical protein
VAGFRRGVADQPAARHNPTGLGCGPTGSLGGGRKTILENKPRRPSPDQALSVSAAARREEGRRAIHPARRVPASATCRPCGDLPASDPPKQQCATIGACPKIFSLVNA